MDPLRLFFQTIYFVMGNVAAPETATALPKVFLNHFTFFLDKNDSWYNVL